MTTEEICEKYDIENYTINEDGSVDVDGSVRLSSKGLSKLPLRFGTVTGDFDIEYNQLTSLEGCPKEIELNFCCFGNQLTSFKGGPSKVGGYVDAGNNEIESLDYAPLEVGGDFYDFFELPENKLGIVIADVCGKGLPAALHMALTIQCHCRCLNRHRRRHLCWLRHPCNLPKHRESHYRLHQFRQFLLQRYQYQQHRHQHNMSH